MISIVALVVALIVAILEYRRALDADRKRVSDFRNLASGILTELIEEADKQLTVAGNIVSEFDGNTAFGPWRAKADTAWAAVQTIRNAAPPNAKMLLVLVEIQEKLDPRRDAPHIIALDAARDALKDRKKTFTDLRTKFLAT